MDQQFYQTGQFAEKASVSLRTLRYYDRVGLLSPSQYTQAGYRLYTERDFRRLQHILALKFLGLSLAQIKVCLQKQPTRLQETLALQKVLLKEKRTHLDRVVLAIEEAEKLLQTNHSDVATLVQVIQVIQMEQNNEWVSNYFTREQQQTMKELSKTSYTPADAQKLAEWGKGWSEDDQKRADQEWSAVASGLKRLVAEGKDPASAEAQAVAKHFNDLIAQFTHGDPGIEMGLSKWWQNAQTLSAEQQPVQLPYGKEEGDYLQKALAIYKQDQQ